MKVLVACEESQRVCLAFREKGHEAYSCDIQPCSGGHPEWHIQGDCLPLLNGDCSFFTEDLKLHTFEGKMGHDHSAPAVYIFDRDGQSVAGHGKIRGKGVEQDGGATEGDSVFL